MMSDYNSETPKRIGALSRAVSRGPVSDTSSDTATTDQLMVDGLIKPIPLEYRPSRVDEVVLDSARRAFREIRDGSSLLVLLDTVHGDAFWTMMEAIVEFATQYDPMVYHNVKGGVKVLQDAWRLRTMQGRLEYQYAPHFGEWVCDVVVDGRRVFNPGIRASSKKLARGLASTMLVYGADALEKVCDISPDRDAVISEGGVSFGPLIAQPAAARRLVGHYGGVDVSRSVEAALSGPLGSKWVRVAVEVIADPTPEQIHEGVANLYSRLLANNFPSSLTHLVKKAVDTPAREWRQFVEYLNVANIYIPMHRQHEAVLLPKMVEKENKVAATGESVYHWFKCEGNNRVVFINPPSSMIGELTMMFINDAVGHYLAFDSETATLGRHKQLKHTGPDVIQIASDSYVAIFQTAVCDSVVQFVRALGGACTFVGVGVMNDVMFLESRDVYAKFIDLRSLMLLDKGPVRKRNESALTYLVKRYLGVTLRYKQKAVSVSDWSVLMLSDVQLGYAIDDVFSVIDVVTHNTEVLSKLRYLPELTAGGNAHFSTNWAVGDYSDAIAFDDEDE